jgi:hypothetical protein
VYRIQAVKGGMLMENETKEKVEGHGQAQLEEVGSGC